MSHHLKVLSKAQLVTTRREGNAIFYRRMLPAASDYPAIVSQLFAAIDDEPRSESLQQAIDRAQTVRGEQSLKFFSENSQRFTAQQDLIVNIADYSETLNEILDTLIADAARKLRGNKRLKLVLEMARIYTTLASVSIM